MRCCRRAQLVHENLALSARALLHARRWQLRRLVQDARGGAGAGLVRLSEGRISGGDTVITCGGWYEVNGDRFTATLTTKRHPAAQASVFGIDEDKLVGRCRGAIATCSSTLDAVPGMVFEATLILSQSQSQESRASRTRGEFDASKLPKPAPAPLALTSSSSPQFNCYRRSKFVAGEPVWRDAGVAPRASLP